MDIIVFAMTRVDNLDIELGLEKDELIFDRRNSLLA
jgi:hypothetical protein